MGTWQAGNTYNNWRLHLLNDKQGIHIIIALLHTLITFNQLSCVITLFTSDTETVTWPVSDYRARLPVCLSWRPTVITHWPPQPHVSLTLIRWISWGGRLWKSFPCILRTGETNTSHEPTQNTPRGRKSWRKEEDHSLPFFVTLKSWRKEEDHSLPSFVTPGFSFPL